MGVEIKYSEQFAKTYPDTVKKQDKIDGVFTETELKKLDPQELVFLASDNPNKQVFDQIVSSTGKKNLCSGLWAGFSKVAAQICTEEPPMTTLTRSYSLEYVQSSSPEDRETYREILLQALGVVRANPVEGRDIFKPNKWKVIPDSNRIMMIPVDKITDLKNHPALKGRALGGDSITLVTLGKEGEVVVETYIQRSVFEKGILSVATVLAHEFYGHTYLVLTGQANQMTDQEQENSAYNVSVPFAEKLRKIFITNAKGKADRELLSKINEVISLEKKLRDSWKRNLQP